MISKTALHAIRALTELGRLPKGKYDGAAAIAGRIGAPPNYLGKLLQTLAREGLVVSQKGLGGGFCLARPPETISLREIVEPIDHVSTWENCVMGLPECGGDHPCAMHNDWAKVREAYLEMLERTKLKELIDHPDEHALTK